MTDDNPSVLSHLSVGTNDFARATGFYDQVLAVLGCTRIMEHPGAVAYGKAYPEFWVQIPVDGKPAMWATAAMSASLLPRRLGSMLFMRPLWPQGRKTRAHRGRGKNTARPITVVLSEIPMAKRLTPHSGTSRWGNPDRITLHRS